MSTVAASARLRAPAASGPDRVDCPHCVVRVENVTQRFGDTVALDDLTDLEAATSKVEAALARL